MPELSNPSGVVCIVTYPKLFQMVLTYKRLPLILRLKIWNSWLTLDKHKSNVVNIWFPHWELNLKLEPYSAPVQDAHTNWLQQDFWLLQSDVKILKESTTIPIHQYAAPLDTNHATLGVPVPQKRSQWNSISASKFSILPLPFLYLPFLNQFNNGSFCAHPLFSFLYRHH